MTAEVVDHIPGLVCDLLGVQSRSELYSEWTQIVHCLNRRDIRRLGGFMAEAGVTGTETLRACRQSAYDFACDLPD